VGTNKTTEQNFTKTNKKTKLLTENYFLYSANGVAYSKFDTNII
jgi:hypothetical protein